MPDVSSATKFFPTAKEGFTTTTSGSVSSGATTVGLTSVSGYTNGDTVVLIIDPTDATKKQAFTGTVDTGGSQITGVVWTEGTNQAHSAGATVVDYETATHWALYSKGLLVQHEQDGTHTSITTDSITVSSGTTLPAGDIGTADLATGAVTAAKIADGAIDATAKIADGVVTSEKLKATVACHAYRSAAFSYSSEADIVFDTESFDVGSNFNTTTGQFTAPVAGYYHISANLGTNDIGDGQQTILRVYANGSAIALATGVGSAAGSDPRIHTSILTFLDAGHIVKATANSSATTSGSGSTNTFISIFLVGQD